MKLTRVTITGADDKTRLRDIVELTKEFPFVEWAILMSPKRAGTPRYPSGAGISRLLVGRPSNGTALHFCGEAARIALEGNGPDGKAGLRLQVNGFTQWVDAHKPLTPFGQWVSQVRQQGSEVILQVQHARALSVARLLADLHPNVSVLWDESGGRGRLTDWPEPLPGLKTGHAGGINPDNVTRAIETLVGRASDQETWIDMESGVRTGDELDCDKVRSVLEAAAPFVQRAGGGTA